MILPDVNVLVYAHRSEFPEHEELRQWLENLVGADQPFAVSELVLSGFIRVVTNPRIFKQPSAMVDAIAFAERLRNSPSAHVVSPGPRHWGIFVELCRVSSAVGNLVPDAYFAALAIEYDLEWISTDKDYAKFPGLRYRNPLTKPA